MKMSVGKIAALMGSPHQRSNKDMEGRVALSSNAECTECNMWCGCITCSMENTIHGLVCINRWIYSEAFLKESANESTLINMHAEDLTMT